MSPPDDYIQRMKRANHERFDYIRSRLASILDGMKTDFTGRIHLDAPVLNGIVGKVEVTISDRQKD